MLVLIGALLVSFILPFAIFFFLRGAHKEDADYKKECKNLLLKGMLLFLPVFGFSLLCYVIFSFTHISSEYPMVEVFFQAFILAAFSEELMKYLLARRAIRRHLASVSFLDLMSYTTIAAIGFEITEAIVYVFSTNVAQVIVRGVTCMHAAFGLIMGFILAKGIKKNGKLSLFPAVLITTIIHGAYDVVLNPALFDIWGDLAVALAALCLVLNLYNFYWISKARKKEYYTKPLFPVQE